MKRTLIALLLAVPLLAQDPPKKSEADAMLDFYIESAKPVTEHQRLAELAGSWTMTTKLWFEPGTPKVSTGTAHGKLILGGRFISIESSVKGDVASDALTIFGFDRRTSDYTMVGYDDLGTYYITAAGKHDGAQKGIVLRGSYEQPPTGQLQKYHFVWTRPGANEHLFSLYFTMQGKDVLVAETRYTRK